MTDDSFEGDRLSISELAEGGEKPAEATENVPAAELAEGLVKQVDSVGDSAVVDAQAMEDKLGLDGDPQAKTALSELAVGVASAEAAAKTQIAEAVGESGESKGKERGQEFKDAVTSGDHVKMVEALFNPEGGIKPADFYQMVKGMVEKTGADKKTTFLDTAGYEGGEIRYARKKMYKDELAGNGKDQDHDLSLFGKESQQREAKILEVVDGVKKTELANAVSKCLETGSSLDKISIVGILGDKKMLQAIEEKIPGFQEEIKNIMSDPEFQTALEANIAYLREGVDALQQEAGQEFVRYGELEGEYNGKDSVTSGVYNVYNGGRATDRYGAVTVDEDKKAKGEELLESTYKYLEAGLDVKNHNQQIEKLSQFLVKKS